MARTFGLLLGPVAALCLVNYLLSRLADVELGFFGWFGSIVAGGIVGSLLLGRQALKKKAQTLDEQGVLALARVTDITETRTSSGASQVLMIGLHIEGPGIAPFDAQQRVLATVTRSPAILSRNLAVLVDPANNEFEIDWKRSALVSGVEPLTVTIDDDGRTYDLTGQTSLVMEYLQALRANHIDLDAADLHQHPAREQVYAVVRRATASDS